MFLNESELNKVQEVANLAEMNTGSQIVPVVTENSDFYESAIWRACFTGLVITSIVLSFLYFFTDISWKVSPFYWILFLLAGSLLFGVLTFYISFLKRKFAGSALIEKRVLEKAETYFLEEEIFNTPSRTGVLIYVSLFEHQVVLMADKGITEKITPGEWDKVINDITDGIKSGKYAQGIIQGIIDVEKILISHGFQIALPNSEKPKDE